MRKWRCPNGAVRRVLDCKAPGIGAAGGDQAMDRAEFAAGLRPEGCEIREGEIEPPRHREAHAADLDGRILVLDDSATLVFGTTIRDY